MNKPEIIVTADGSHTLYHMELDETYHSRHGAMTESIHVFIDNGLKQMVVEQGMEELSVLEVGFGTGLNAALTLFYSQSHGTNISYTTLEPFPLDIGTAAEMNYFEGEPARKREFIRLHELPWETVHRIGHFEIQKLKLKIEDFVPGCRYDLVYFDAFAPEKQPELWILGVLQKIFDLMEKGGILSTYCAKGEFKRNLKKAGFEVFAVPGPSGGKREMTRGVKM